MSNSSQHVVKDGLTPGQRKSMNMSRALKERETAKRKAKNSRKLFKMSKQKYYCPKDKEGYWASSNHIHCKNCYREYRGDLHDPILFDKSKGHQW